MAPHLPRSCVCLCVYVCGEHFTVSIFSKTLGTGSGQKTPNIDSLAVCESLPYQVKSGTGRTQGRSDPSSASLRLCSLRQSHSPSQSLFPHLSIEQHFPPVQLCVSLTPSPRLPGSPGLAACGTGTRLSSVLPFQGPGQPPTEQPPAGAEGEGAGDAGGR